MKASIEEVASIVEDKGIGYAVANYMAYTAIEDEVLKEKWKQAEKAIDDVMEILEPYLD